MKYKVSYEQAIRNDLYENANYAFTESVPRVGWLPDSLAPRHAQRFCYFDESTQVQNRHVIKTWFLIDNSDHFGDRENMSDSEFPDWWKGIREISAFRDYISEYVLLRLTTVWKNGVNTPGYS